jgi:hypothetical protein
MPSFVDHGDRIEFVNDDGSWWVWKNHTSFAGGKNVGPGYVGRMVRADGKVIVDDTVNVSHIINEPRAGGLGCFGIHAARANGEADVYNRTWDVTGRRNDTLGIKSSSVIVPPYLSADGLSIRASFGVVLGDGYGELVKLRYDYLCEASCLKQWVTAETLYNGALPSAFVKEPKIVCGIGPTTANGIVYTKADVFDSASVAVRPQIDLPSIGDPTVNTVQLGQNARVRVRLRAGTSDYFNVVAEANTAMTYDPVTLKVTNYGTRSVWEGSTVGLDKWAQASNGRTVFENTGGAYCLQGPGSTLTRQWEIARRPAEPECGIMFHAWEGGSGYPDCLKCYRAYGPVGEKYTTFMCYSNDAGWVL